MRVTDSVGAVPPLDMLGRDVHWLPLAVDRLAQAPDRRSGHRACSSASPAHDDRKLKIEPPLYNGKLACVLLSCAKHLSEAASADATIGIDAAVAGEQRVWRRKRGDNRAKLADDDSVQTEEAAWLCRGLMRPSGKAGSGCGAHRR